MNIHQFFNTYSSNLFIECDSEKISYHAFLQKVKSASNLLNKCNVQKNDVVLLHNLPIEVYPLWLFSIWSIGAIAFPLSYKFVQKQIEDACTKSGAKFIISKKKTISKLCCWIKPVPINNPKKNLEIEISWNLDIPATIIQTSGSSGAPKLAVHSLKNHLLNALAVNNYFSTTESDNWLLALPVWHVAGLAIIFRVMLCGSTLCLPKENTPLEENIKMFSPSHISLVPAQLWRLLKYKFTINYLKQCRVIFLGGSSIPYSLIQKSLDVGLNIYTSYGLTEASSTVAVKKSSDFSTEWARVLPCFKVTTKKDGEILLKGDPLFMGYYKNAKTQNALNNQGWFETKDLGSIKNSMINVLGRKDNMFISGGENIYPEEIEKELLKIEWIKNAVVVPKLDSEFGQRPIAFIESKESFSESGIKILLKKTLPSFKIPDQFLPWPEQLDQVEMKTYRHYFKSLV